MLRLSRILQKLTLSLACLSGFGPSPLWAESSCDPKAWPQFLAKAQALLPETETVGPAFLRCSSVEMRDAATFWLSFYYHKTMQKERFVGLLKERGFGAGTGGKAQAQYRAWQGDPLSLKTRIQAGEAGLADDLGMLLVLARTSMRARLYKEGLDSYQTYLRQSENQDDIEVERVFAYIWADDESGARGQIASLRRYEMNPSLRQSLERAEVLLDQGKAKAEDTPDKQGAWVQLAGRSTTNNGGYASQSLLMFYEGPVNVEMEASQERSSLEPDRHPFALFQLGKEWHVGSHAELETEVGYLTLGTHHFTGTLGTQWHLGEQGQLGLKLERAPLILQGQPLIEPRAGVMRDSLVYAASYGRKLRFEGALRRDDGGAWYEDYSLNLRVGSSAEEKWTQGFSLLIPFAYQQHPQPSPDMLSYPREFKAGLGLELLLTDGSSYRWVSEAILQTVNRSYFQNPDSFQKLLEGTLRSELRAYLRNGFFTFAKGELVVTEKNPGEANDAKKTTVMLGIAFQDLVRGAKP